MASEGFSGRRGRLVIWLAAGVLGLSVVPLAAAHSAPGKISFTAAAGNRWVATFTTATSRGAAAQALAGSLIRKFDDRRLILRGSRTALQQALENAQAAWTGDVLVEPDIWVKPTATDPNDPYYAPYQWDMMAQTASNYGISLPAARDHFTAGNVGKGVAVAILDTGITAHSDLPALPSSWAGSGIGWDFVDNDNNPSDPGDWTTLADGCAARNSSWHGTHVAGTIAAQTNNSKGVAGIAPDVTLEYGRVLGKCGGNFTDITDAVRWASGQAVTGRSVTPGAVSQRADVINLSLGGGGSCPTYFQDAANAAKANGTLIVVAAGNDGVDASGFTPANCSGVVTVAATNVAGGRASYSNYGSTVEIAAPGGDGGSCSSYSNTYIVSTWNAGTTTPGTEAYGCMAGTSMATPHVVGVAALVLSLYEQSNPGQTLTPAQVEQVLYDSAVQFPVLSGANPCSTVGNCGAGVVNADAALNKVGTPVAATAYTLTGPSQGMVNTASSNFTVTVNGSFTGTITVTANGGGYSNQPFALIFDGTSTSKTFSITPTATGTVTLSAADNKSLTDPASINYVVVSPATSYTFTGPAAVYSSTPSGNFTVTVNGYFVGSISVALSGAGLSGSVSVTFDGTQTSKTFAITPTDVGTLTLTPSNAAGLTNASRLTYSVTTSARSFTLNGPASLAVGTPATFTVAPDGTYKGTITVTWTGGGAGASVTFTNTSAPKTVTLTPSVGGAFRVSATDTPATGATAMTDPAPLDYMIPVPPAAFNKLSPANPTSGLSRTTVAFSWGSSTGATSYQICITTTKTCATNGWTPVGLVTSWTYTGSLKSRTTYYWQVRAVNSVGSTLANAGTYWSFTTVR